MIDDAFVYVSDACLSSVRVHYENKSDIIKSSHDATSRTGSHVAKNLSAVNAYPIESGMRKDVGIGPNVNERHQIKQLNEQVIPAGEILKLHHTRKNLATYHDNFCVKKYFIPEREIRERQ